MIYDFYIHKYMKTVTCHSDFILEKTFSESYLKTAIKAFTLFSLYDRSLYLN